VAVYYWLDRTPAATEPLTVEFLDGDTVLRTFSSAKKEDAAEDDDRAEDVARLPEPKAGLNRVVWDMRIARPSLLPRAIIWGNSDGPRVSPGTYSVRFKFGGETVTKAVTIAPNPNVAVSAEDLKRQFDLLRDLRDRLTETHRAVRRIRDVRAQIAAVVARAGDLGKADALRDRAKAIDQKLEAIERRLVNPDVKSGQDVLNFPPALDHQIVGIATVVASADQRPTDASFAYYGQVKSRLEAILAELGAIYDKDVAEFNGAVRDQGIPPVVPGK
jgi:hypothetical protein